MGKKVELKVIDGKVMKYAVLFQHIEPDYEKMNPQNVDDEPTILVKSFITLFSTEGMAMDSIIHANENEPNIQATEIGWVNQVNFV